MKKASYAAVFAVALGMSVLGAGCNAAGDNDPTPVTHFKITPASGSFATPSPVPPATPISTASSNPGKEIAIAAKNSNLKFDQESITVGAGSVTIRFDNADSGIPHNFHLFEGGDAKGTSVGQTDLASGPVEQELKLDLTPGRYHFQCDAHPTTMKGTLTVS